jgi:hypothetical protein
MKHAAGLFLSIALACAGCTAHTPVIPAALTGDSAHPGVAAGWVRTELYFGLGAVDSPTGVDEAAWRVFIDKEVTPRFPAGLTVIDGYGQWQGEGQATPERLRSKIVVLLHPDTATQRTAIEAIRSAWKARTGDQSVLRVTQPAEVSF